MDDLIDAIGRNFERVLRWVYPAALFLTLLRLARPGDFEKLAGVEHPWGLLVGGLVAGVIAYLAQGYLVNQFVSVSFILLGWDVNVQPFRLHQRIQRALSWGVIGWLLRRLARLLDAMACNTRRRWILSRNGPKLSSWLDYAWGLHHAMSITGWLTILFWWLWKDPGSRFARTPDWEILAPASALLLASLWFHAMIVRIPIR